MQESALTGIWWRATGYELRDSYLRPVLGAKFKRYSPLDDHDDVRSRRRDYVPAYLSLIRIVDVIESRETVEQAILQWCEAHGLLGLLLHQVQQVRFAPRWERLIPASAEAKRSAAVVAKAARAARMPDGQPINWEGAGDDQPRLRLTQTLYRRTSCGTFIWGDDQLVYPAVAPEDAEPGAVAEDRFWRLAAPGAVLQRLSTREWKEEPLSESWASFFPDVLEEKRVTHAYPIPYSDEFWISYAEPIQDFVTAAQLLREAFIAASGKRLGPGRPRAHDVVRHGPHLLNALVAPAGPILVRDEENYEQRLIAPSLLGAVALMAQLDLAGHRRFLRCRNDRCRKLFVGSNVQSAYCSRHCRSAHHARGAPS